MAFSFGSTPTPAPAGGASAGAGANAPSTGFSFGGAPAASTPGTAGAAPPQSFGTSTPSAAPAFGTQVAGTPTPTPAPAGGFNFGGHSTNTGTGTAAPTPAPTTPGFSTLAGFSSPAPQAGGHGAQPQLTKIPNYDEVFSSKLLLNIQELTTRSKVEEMNLGTYETNSSSLAGQELVQKLLHDSKLQSLLLQSPVPTFAAPNQSLRQQLAQRPTVLLSTEDGDREGNLTPVMLQQVMSLAEDMKISETDALCLYAQASNDRARMAMVEHLERDRSVPPDAMRSSPGQSDLLDPSSLERNVPLVARELYFFEKKQQLRTLLLLFQERLDDLRSDGSGGHVVHATDCLLQKGLVDVMIKAVQDFSSRIEEIVQEISRSSSGLAASMSAWNPYSGLASPSVAKAGSGNISSNRGSKGGQKRPVSFREVHLDFFIKEREKCANLLFIIAYQAQLTGQEIAGLVDLVRDLSNRLGPALDPFDDVPSPYENDTADEKKQQDWMTGGTPFYGALPPKIEKDRFQWQNELINKTFNTGKPQLLRCVSIVVMSVVTALDARATLTDRHTHRVNEFGAGNALLPPGSSSTNNLQPIHSKLSGDGDGWERKDVLGILMASYSLLLRTSLTGLTSPRVGGPATPTGGGIDIRKAWRKCLEAPTELKSFTFGRLCLLQALRYGSYAEVSSSKFDAKEFHLSVLAEFTSQYLDMLSASGDQPISRAKWEQDAEEDLRLRRTHQDQQRQFLAWSGTTEDLEKIPLSVDLLSRPDCMDDVVAFATSVCSLGRDYATLFWATETLVDDENSVKILKPSRTLGELEHLQETDESLAPCFVAFLAALSLAGEPGDKQNGGTKVHEFLSLDHAGAKTGQVSWLSVLGDLRHYARELSPNSTAASNSVGGVSSSSSTTYYYAYEEEADRRESSRFGSSQDGTKKSSSSAGEKIRELGEYNSFVMSSHLGLLSNVCSSCAEARAAVLSSKLPIQSSDSSEVIGQDSALGILFALAISPLSPELRGMVFNAISGLLSTTGAQKEDITTIQECALEAWDLLESYQVLPISMLDQYPTSLGTERKIVNGLAFPPSSTSMVVEKDGKSWIPSNPAYSILYEMEYVESSRGIYPSTEGFLRLILSLLTVAGSPRDLGRNWRLRTGCSPYIEYAIHLVLPRALGNFADIPALPFFSSLERCRLVFLALEVAEAAVNRYLINPDFSAIKSKDHDILHRANVTHAKDVLGMDSLAHAVVVRPTSKDIALFFDDFSPTATSLSRKTPESNGQFVNSSGSNDLLSTTPTPRSDLVPPAPKSPSLTVLADILSSQKGNLFSMIVRVLTEHGLPGGDTADAESASLALALFNDTPPSLACMKEMRRKSKSSSRQSLLKGLSAGSEVFLSGSLDHCWERTVLVCLRILCAAIVREDGLHEALATAPNKNTLVPILRFQKSSRAMPASTQVETNLTSSKLSSLLIDANAETGVLRVITTLIGDHFVDDELDSTISQAAAAIMFYVEQVLPQEKSLSFLYPSSSIGEKYVARAFGDRLRLAASRMLCTDAELFDFVLNKVLERLRRRDAPGIMLALQLFGLGGAELEVGRVGTRSGDCFDALLRVVEEDRFVTSPASSSSAALVFESFTRFVAPMSGGDSNVRRAINAAGRLRSVDFWRVRLSRVSALMFNNSSVVEDENVVHSVSWLLRGIAAELQLIKMTVAGFPQPVRVDSLTSFLLSPPHDLLQFLLNMIPMEVPPFEPNLFSLPEEAVRKAKKRLKGSDEVVQGFETIDLPCLLKNFHETDDVSLDAITKWSEQWNLYVRRDCAAAHLTSSFHLLLASLASVDLTAFPELRLGGSRLLSRVLERMTRTGSNGRFNSMDSLFYSAATRNLALAAMVSADIFVAETRSSGAVEADIDASAAVSTVNRAILISGTSTSPNTLIAGRIDERTTILCCTLALLLSNIPCTEAVARDVDSFYASGLVLGRLACASTGARIPFVPSTGNRVARACIGMILDIFADEKSPFDPSSFIHKGLLATDNRGTGPTSLHSLVGLLAKLDGDVPDVLQRIALVDGGAKVLIEAGVLESLSAAAELYVKEEERAHQSHSALSYRQPESVVPHFLMGHLNLLCVMMESEVGDDLKRVLASTASEILATYAPVLDRILKRFPVDGDTIRVVTKCTAQTRLLMRSTRHVALQNVGKVGPSNSAFGSFECKLAALTMHLAENPLPRSCMSPLPSLLSIPHGESVSTSISSDKSWWDLLDLRDASGDNVHWPGDNSMSDNVVEYAAVGMDILRSGLSILRSSPQPHVCDTRALAAGLCRCSDAFRFACFNSQNGSIWNRSRGDSCTAKSLVSLLADAIIDLLLLMTIHIKEVKHRSMLTEEIRSIFVASLDHSRLDVTGLHTPGISNLPIDENRPDYGLELAKSLRKELNDSVDGISTLDYF